jgi:Ras-related protein Rab-8A
MINQVLKIIIVGEFGVGKTTAVFRFVEGKFRTNTKSTIGVDLFFKNMILDEEKKSHIDCQFWDFAGEPRFKDIHKLYAPGTAGVIYVFENGDIKTLFALKDWQSMLNHGIDLNKIPKILISTKNDLENKIDKKNIQEIMTQLHIKDYYETSSKTGENIRNVFNDLIVQILHKFEEIEKR